MPTLIIVKGAAFSRSEKAAELTQKLLDSKNLLNHPDFYELNVIDGKKNISIEQAREMVKQISLKPRISKNKVVLIKEAQRLSLEAQNAILKILEEPPKYATIILTVDHPKNIIQTVLSRGQIIDLGEFNKVNTNADEFLSHAQNFLKLINSTQPERVDWVTENKALFKDRHATIQLLHVWELILRDLLVVKAESEESIIIDGLDYSLVFDNLTVDQLIQNIKYLQKMIQYIDLYNANTQLCVESFLVNL